jgi:hypothetical protein
MEIFSKGSKDYRYGRGVRHQEIHIISLGNTRKYQEIPKNVRKY